MKMMKMFKSYSPLPASPLAVLGMRWKGGGLRGGGGSLNDRRISEGAEGAAAQRQPEANTFNGSPPN